MTIKLNIAKTNNTITLSLYWFLACIMFKPTFCINGIVSGNINMQAIMYDWLYSGPTHKRFINSCPYNTNPDIINAITMY